MKELSDCNGWWLVGAAMIGVGVWALVILALVSPCPTCLVR